ncbi:unnamed protein product [Rotaria socialis]|nr:unnamed protein product [Rotaria socialis]CAF3636456.1 unnamed protein product [Rotaria socialis]
MKSFSINRLLITLTMKPNKESEEIAAAEGIIDLIEDANESVANTFENLMTAIKNSSLLLDGLTSIGADNTNVNMGNTHSVYTLFHNQIENLFKCNCYCHILHNGIKWGHQQLTVDVEKFLMMTCAHFSCSAKRVEELKSYYEFYEHDFRSILTSTFPKNVAFLEAAGHFGYGIENLTWNQIQQCIEITKIKGLNEDDLFNEFTELKLTFEIIKKKEITIFDHIPGKQKIGEDARHD